MPAVKSRKDTKAPAKKAPANKVVKEAPAQKETESSKRKRVSFKEEANKKKAVGKKAAKVAVKEEEEEKDDSEEEEEQIVEKAQEIDAEDDDLTEEQEEALRKEILGDMASSGEDEDSSDEEADAIDSNENVVTLDGKKLEESMTETKKTFDKKSKSAKVSIDISIGKAEMNGLTNIYTFFRLPKLKRRVLFISAVFPMVFTKRK